MNAKIPDGLKLKGNMSFFEINELMKRVREEAEKIQMAHFSKSITEKVTRFVDESLILNPARLMKRYGLKEPIYYPSPKLSSSSKDESDWRKCHCNVLLFPVEDQVLALVFGHEMFSGLFFDKYQGDQLLEERVFTEFEEFGYWDYVDPPSYVPKEEWLKRGELWAKALENSGVPLKNSIACKVASADFGSKLFTGAIAHEDYRNAELKLMGANNCFYSKMTVVDPPALGKAEYVPSKEERLERLVENVLSEEFIQKELPKLMESGVASHECYSSFAKFKSSDRGKEISNQIIEKYSSKLPEIIPEYFEKIEILNLYQ